MIQLVQTIKQSKDQTFTKSHHLFKPVHWSDTDVYYGDRDFLLKNRFKYVNGVSVPEDYNEVIDWVKRQDKISLKGQYRLIKAIEYISHNKDTGFLFNFENQ